MMLQWVFVDIMFSYFWKSLTLNFVKIFSLTQIFLSRKKPFRFLHNFEKNIIDKYVTNSTLFH